MMKEYYRATGAIGARQSDNRIYGQLLLNVDAAVLVFSLQVFKALASCTLTTLLIQVT